MRIISLCNRICSANSSLIFTEEVYHFIRNRGSGSQDTSTAEEYIPEQVETVKKVDAFTMIAVLKYVYGEMIDCRTCIQAHGNDIDMLVIL